jgi:uncharacterized protein
MALTALDLERVAAAEASHLRMIHLQRMTPCELRALLGSDPARAVPWVASAAEHGLPAAQLRLGRMLLEGQGVSKNATEALYWFTRAADQLDADAMNMVGRCHENGWGTDLNPSTAVHWYRRSADRGHDWGQYNFGNMLFDGRGIEPNLEQALLWYQRAARQGHSRAMNLLGRCYEQGWGCSQDIITAYDWYCRSAQAGYFRGQFNYASLLMQNRFEREAAEWFSKALQAGGAQICRAIAALVEQAREPELRALRERIAKLSG